MADYVIDQNNRFEYTYSAKEQEEVERIRNKYLPKKESKFEQLKRLDKSAEKRGTIISITVGIIGVLFLGMGMCCTMLWNTQAGVFAAGILLGVAGILLTGLAYPINQKITEKERAKIADQIIALSNELSFEK